MNPHRLYFRGPTSQSYSFSHNHGSGKWLYLKGNYYWRDPFLTSMIMGGSVNIGKPRRLTTLGSETKRLVVTNLFSPLRCNGISWLFTYQCHDQPPRDNNKTPPARGILHVQRHWQSCQPPNTANLVLPKPKKNGKQRRFFNSKKKLQNRPHKKTTQNQRSKLVILVILGFKLWHPFSSLFSLLTRTPNLKDMFRWKGRQGTSNRPHTVLRVGHALAQASAGIQRMDESHTKNIWN